MGRGLKGGAHLVRVRVGVRVRVRVGVGVWGGVNHLLGPREGGLLEAVLFERL